VLFTKDIYVIDGSFSAVSEQKRFIKRKTLLFIKFFLKSLNKKMEHKFKKRAKGVVLRKILRGKIKQLE